MNRRTYRHWTHQEIRFLHDHYGQKSLKEIAKELDRTKDSVQFTASRQGLTETHDYNDWTVNEVRLLETLIRDRQNIDEITARIPRHSKDAIIVRASQMRKKRAKSGNPLPPIWVSVFTPQEYDDLIELVKDGLTASEIHKFYQDHPKERIEYITYKLRKKYKKKRKPRK